MSIQEYIKPELLILIPVLYLIGEGIKKSNIDNKHIPLLLGTISVALSSIYVFSAVDVYGTKSVLTEIFTAITQGVLCAGASVYANQLIKQSKKE